MNKRKDKYKFHISFCFVLHSLVTCDKTWVHYFMPQTKRISMEWQDKDSPALKQAKTTFCREGIASIFWDSQASYSLIFWQNNELSMQLIIWSSLWPTEASVSFRTRGQSVKHVSPSWQRTFAYCHSDSGNTGGNALGGTATPHL
jgi:outer membrane biogenesis lipoprotein LolB